MARRIGYSVKETGAVPGGANLGLGCGNPQAIAALRTGETVLDLGSGAGFDAFLAARAVGTEGKVIGVDMTPEMIEKARRNLASDEFSMVEFRLGEIENLPVPDSSVDVIISDQFVVRQTQGLPRGFPCLAGGRPPGYIRRGRPDGHRNQEAQLHPNAIGTTPCAYI